MVETDAAYKRTRLTPALVTAAAPLTWGTTYLVTTQLLPPRHPLFDAAVRALPAGAAILLLTRQLPRGAWWWKAAVLGALNIGAFFALLFVAAYRLPGGVAAILGGAQPLIVAVLAYVILGEPATLRAMGWALTALGGVSILVLHGRVNLDLLGVAAGLGATASMAAGIVLSKRWGRPVPLITFTGWQLMAGGLLLTPAALIAEGGPPTLDWSAILGYAWITVAGTVAAYVIWFRGIERLRPAALSLLSLLSPVVATTLGWIVLGQSLGAIQIAGLCAVLVAMVMGQ